MDPLLELRYEKAIMKTREAYDRAVEVIGDPSSRVPARKEDWTGRKIQLQKACNSGSIFIFFKKETKVPSKSQITYEG